MTQKAPVSDYHDVERDNRPSDPRESFRLLATLSCTAGHSQLWLPRRTVRPVGDEKGQSDGRHYDVPRPNDGNRFRGDYVRKQEAAELARSSYSDR